MIAPNADEGSLMMIRPRRNWTPEEDVILKREVRRVQAEGDNISWHDIAAFLPGRTNKDCRKRWYGTAAAKVKKGPWTESEDERLRRAIERHGTKWAVVASVVGTRLPDQCSKRWSHAINPDINHSPWTPQEDELLMQYVNKHGHYWQQIVSLYFPGRTSLAAKNRYHILQRRLKSEESAVADGVCDWERSNDGSLWQEILWSDPSQRQDSPPWTGRSDHGLPFTTRSPTEPVAPARNFFTPDKGPSWLPLTPCSPLYDAPADFLNDPPPFQFPGLPTQNGDSGIPALEYPFPSTVTVDELLLQSLSSTHSTAIPTTTSPSPPVSSSTNTTPTTESDQRRLCIEAVCSTDKLSALFEAVTRYSVSAVIKTDD
ncbi:uncharacterized protein DSM5745_08513 [Aspergillus mulundensis]|uniref:Uncharacterized protein n=1 Tax=Aspergillus mulundensis TaxID=1810919 RepID=A0A3D8R3W9_9EURO|nr:hypothetical protein DSM5745_08513 [Aspergillus mulundensis]RDW68753.1 hypothetical protein DSM5745_08513 [Aspergillus mulundensis]